MVMASISERDVIDLFQKLTSGEWSRERVAEYADALRRLDDEGELFIAGINKALTWDVLIYLTGVDLMTRPGEYFHVIEDFDIKFAEFKNSLLPAVPS